MRVLYVAQNYQPMDASSITTYGIVRKLAEKGHKITLLVPQRCPKECVRNCSMRCNDDTNIVVTRVPTLAPYYIINEHKNLGALILSFTHLFVILWGVRICGKKRIHVIVSQHHLSHFASFSAFVLSRIFKLPLVVKTHDVFDSASKVYESLFLSMLFNVYRVVLRWSDHVLVVSGPLRSKTIERYKLDKSKVTVFPTGVDTKKFRPDIDSSFLQHDLHLEGKKILLFIGRIREERGLAVLMKALPRITAKTSDVRVLIVGDGPKKSDLVRLIQELRVERLVTFVRSVGHDEIPRYICMSDMAIGPLVATIDTYGSVPRKVLEYMACAKPVVACRGGVSQDLIVDGYNGFLFGPGNVDDLAPVILKAISNPGLVKKMGLNARRYIEDFYDWDKIMSVFEKVLYVSLTNVKR